MSTVPDAEESEPEPVHRAHAVASWVGLATLLCLVVGALVALFWALVVRLPVWSVAADGSATMTERGWTAVVSVDAWYVVCAVLVGPGIGWVMWRWFKPLGWPAALLAAGAGLLTGLVCWQLGEVMGPGPFADRIAAANPGDQVPAAMELSAISALAVWPMMAVVPALFGSAFGREPEEPPAVGGAAEGGASPGDVGEPAAGDGQQVGGRELDV